MFSGSPGFESLEGYGGGGGDAEGADVASYWDVYGYAVCSDCATG